MSKIDLANELVIEQIPRWQKVIDHVQATINLFNNTPFKVKKDFRCPYFFVIFEALDKKGNIRTLSYNCFSEEEQNKTANRLAEHFNLDVEEITD